MRLCKTIFVISVIFFNKVASEERDDEESTLKLTEKQPPVRAFTAAELSKYDGSNVSFSLWTKRCAALDWASVPTYLLY